MKQRISIHEINPGDTCSEDLYFDSAQLFAAAHIPIRQKDIQSAKQWGIEYLYTNGTILHPVKQQTQSVPTPKIASLYDSIVTAMSKTITSITSNKTEARKGIDTLVDAIESKIKNPPQGFFAYAFSYNSSLENSFANTSINIAIISALTGQVVGLTGLALGNLIRAALLHDVGMIGLSKTSEKSSPLNAQETNLLKAHTLISFQIITKVLGYDQEVGGIALQHHERWDGGGYPRGLKAELISVSARIISVVDAYIAMIQKKPYRPALLGYAAMKALLADNSQHFDPNVIKAFIEVMGVYPLGSLVELNDGSICQVLETRKGSALKPLVSIIQKDKETPSATAPSLIDLSMDKSLYIVRAVAPL